MKKTFIAIILYCCCFTSYSQSSYWQQQVNYTIDVTLHDKEHTLDGFEKMEYFNNSPDTLKFIWFHLWPNAYKNDRTAFSEQFLNIGRTDFYFSDNDKRGYINRLDFAVDGIAAKLEDHPEHQDIVKLVLPKPLAPGASIKIQTPFHVQLPFNFSRGGYNGESFQVTQWYPKPAVYDRFGWHPMPYLDQGEFYSEFGNYNVQITLPKNYVVAATGELQEENEKEFLKTIAAKKLSYEIEKPIRTATKKKTVEQFPASAAEVKTIHFTQNNVHDFAWFADKRFALLQDTMQLQSGRIIQVAAYWPNKPVNNYNWKRSLQFMKNTIRNRSLWLGEYPYNTATALEATMGFTGGMEYPTITSISPSTNEAELEGTIEHELGHNWNYGILATNERDHPWMDEGINSYYDGRYEEKKIVQPTEEKPTFSSKRRSDDMSATMLNTLIHYKKDQPIQTTSQDFTDANYGLVAYYKTSKWMQLLEQRLGRSLFDSCMQAYYQQWKFKHPYPEDLKKVMEEVSKQNLDSEFALLNKTGKLPGEHKKKDVKFASFYSLKDTDKHHYIFGLPAVGYNNYDKFMIGAMFHNYTLAPEKFQFVVAPLYSTNSKQLRGLGKITYQWNVKGIFQYVNVSVGAASFSTKESRDTNDNKIFESFHKIEPSIQLYFKHDVKSKLRTWIDFRTFFIGEKRFDNYGYKTDSDSSVTYPLSSSTSNRYINQLSFNAENNRVLYPYNYQVQLQQGKGFYRFNLTGNYFFNYSKGGGFKVRVFAAKFGFIGEKQPGAFLYQPKLLSGNGEDDYTYSQYFLGRTASASNPELPVANKGLAMQQLMIQNTGGLKFRFDTYPYLQGQSGNWVAAINMNTTLPEQLIPKVIPLSVFADVGSYSEGWRTNAATSRILYTAGLQLSLFKKVLNIYVPILYSKDFRNLLKTDAEQNKFWKKVSFSIDMQQLKIRKFIPQLPL